ncbi:MAG: hypothetical protein H7X86_03600 [Gorillibacterium sp.]|nr:hypothetical protein [Gorillibacterium sp.]
MIFSKRMKQKWISMSLAFVLGCSLILFTSPRYAIASTVTGTINWGSATGKYAGDYTYGLNIFQAQETGVASNTDYKNNVAYMKPGMIRYHRADMMSDSTTTPGLVLNPTGSNYSWDVNKINGILTQTFSNNPVRMINIANWPAYMDDGTGKLRTDMYNAYAAFCAQLVQIVNINQNHNVQYWEITNEKDDAYANNMIELANLYKQVYDAMRAKSSTIKIGGPSFARPDLTSRVSTFIANSHQKLDFVSFHTYVSGSSSDSNAVIWDRAQGLGGHTTDFKNIISQYTTRNIEVFHDEFNISWNPPENRMNNEIGMIFDALTVMSAAKAGASGTMAWNEADGWYGKLEGWAPYNKRGSAHLYSILNSDMKGDIVTNSVSDATKVDLMAVKTGSWKKTMLVNRSGSDQTVQLNMSGWSTTIPGNTLFTVKRVFNWGVSYENVRYDVLTSSGGFNLWNNSVAVLVLDENNKQYDLSNPVKNDKFEDGLNFWSTSGTNLEADYTESWAGFEGNHLTHWKNAAYNVYTYQTVTGLTNGTYTLRAKISSSGGQSTARVEANNFGGTNKSVNIPGTGTYSWQDITISNIQVSNNQLEIGFRSSASANQWLYADNVELIKN